MSGPDCFVIRPGGTWRGVVPVGVALWVGERPVLEDRVIFLDRPLPWTPSAGIHNGRAYFEGKEWVVMADGVEETWQDEGTHWIRYRARLVDELRYLVVGAYYWLEEA